MSRTNVFRDCTSYEPFYPCFGALLVSNIVQSKSVKLLIYWKITYVCTQHISKGRRGKGVLKKSSDSALITMSLTTTPTSRFCFNMMWGKFYRICFEITARTVLAQFGHFTLKTRVRFQNGEGFDPPTLGAPPRLLLNGIYKHSSFH